MSELQYAEFRSLPCRYDDAETWLFVKGRWQPINIAGRHQALIPRSKASFKWLFGADLPLLPHSAFLRSGERD
jgi:hypothetical protein